MKFIVDNGPHIKDKDNTSKIMKRLLIALLPIIIFSIYKNGIIPYQAGYATFYQALRPLLIIVIASATSLIAEGLFVRLVLHKKGKDLISYIKHSYAIFPGLFLALVLPINTPLWLVLLGALVATIIGKMLFGGFGYNIFNPALIGYLFVTSSYGSLIAARGGYLNNMEIDTISKATPLTNLGNLDYVGTWDTIGSEFGTLWDFFLGFIPGTIGDTSKILILVALLYLIFTKVIKWRIPVIYILTVLVMTTIIGLYNGMGLWYPLFHVLTGGLLFGAVFMATDPVTSPITKNGQVMFALALGLLTVIFRFLTPYPEGVLTAILTMNMLVFILDRIGAKTMFNPKKILLPLSILIVLILGMGIFIANRTTPESRVSINDIKVVDDKVVYNVSTRGFVGIIEADILIKQGKIIEINIIRQNESYWSEIDKVGYLDRLINNQADIYNVDTISGVTVTSGALKGLLITVLEDYEGGSN